MRGPRTAPRSQVNRRQKHRLPPPLIFIEKAIYPTLLRCSQAARSVYLCYSRYANKHTALAYPRQTVISKLLGFTPYNTDPKTGRRRAGITQKQEATRKKQLRRLRHELGAAIAELQGAGLIRSGSFHNSKLDRTYSGYYLLNARGARRTVANGFLNEPFVMISAAYFYDGTFALRSHHARRPVPPPSDDALKLFLLALRDFDALRFNGIDPNQLILSGQSSRLEHGTWRAELGLTALQCQTAIDELIDGGYLCPIRVVAHTLDQHFIRLSPAANAPDEIDLTLLYPSVLVAPRKAVFHVC